MPDYRRFIAYFYEYIDGKRQRNAGFVKAERRNEVWRVTLQLKAAHWPGSSMKIYGYFQETDRYEPIFLGNGYPQGESMIQQLHLSAQITKDSGKGFGNLNGMWIPCGENRCFLSSWDEGEADVGRLREAAENNGRNREDEREENTERVTGEAVEISQVQEITKNQEPSVIIEAAECAADKMMDGETSDGEAADRETAGQEVSDRETADREASGPEASDQEASDQEASDQEASDREASGQEASDREASDQEASDREAAGQEISEQETADAQRVRDVEGTDAEINTEPAWNVLRSRCQRLPVFEREGWECIRICPRDVMWLRQQRWPVGRNSFLIRGFCQYHHILLGRNRDDGMILGVPGRETGQEQKMALTFGFPEFRPAGTSGGFSEEFGYWCRML